MKRLLTYMLIVPILALTACEPGDTEDFTMLETDTLAVDQDDRQARAELQGWLDEVDANIAQLETRLQAAGTTSEIDMEDLNQRRDDIRMDLQSIGEDTRMWTSTSADDIKDRLRDLDSDIEEARLNSYEQRDEFIAEARTRLQEIDSELASLERRTDAPGTMTPEQRNQGVDPQDPGVIDDPVDDPTTGRRDGAYGTPGAPGTPIAGTSRDVDVEGMQDDRAEIAQQLNEAEAEAETDFESTRENLAESVADLHARVQAAGFELRTDFSAATMPTSPNTASTN